MNSMISASEYTSKNFLEFENEIVSRQQLNNFTDIWFQTKEPGKVKKFIQKFNKSEQIKKVATNQLLLTLLWLVFEQTGDLPSNLSYFYKEGLDILLNKWDSKPNTQQVYKKLSLQRQKDLLSYIALKTFERGDYFFNQKELEQYITDYIRNLPNAQTDPEVLQLDSAAVLKSISTQHGLLVERAKGIYSFCDQTIHEYFAAREIISSPNPLALEKALQNLVERVTEPRWREVFLLAAGMLQNADYLLKLMKRQTDALVGSEQELQNFLTWLHQKSSLCKAIYKPSAFRAFYIEFVLNLDFDLARTLDNNFAYDIGFNLPRLHMHTHSLQNCQCSQQFQKALKQYYDANKLLVDFLNNAHYVTRTVRKEIEESLLLPCEI